MRYSLQDTNHRRDDGCFSFQIPNNLKEIDNNMKSAENNTAINFRNIPRQYREIFDFIEDGIYDEIPVNLMNSISTLQPIEKKRFISDFLLFIFSSEFFEVLLKNNSIYYIAKSLFDFNDNFWKEAIQSSLSNVGLEEISKLFSIFVLKGDFNYANNLLPYTDRDLSKYPSTLKKLISNNEEYKLNYLLKNLSNIHFGSDELLRMCSSMSTSFVMSLIEDFSMDYNKTSPYGDSLLSLSVINKNIYLFSDLIAKYSFKINFSSDSLYNTIEKEKAFDFYNILLSNVNLKPSHIERIGLFLFSESIPERLFRSDLYSNLFKHPSFDDHIFNLGQGYFLYGLLSKLGMISKKISHDAARPYVHILSDYLDSYNKSVDNFPCSPEFNVVGAAVQVAKICESQPAIDSLVMVLRKFPKHINTPNPNGLLPIQQVEVNSSIYQILLNNGAVKPEPISFWSNIKSIFVKPKVNVLLNSQQLIESKASIIPSVSNIRSKLRNDFLDIQSIINSPTFDLDIKIKCENMFLRSEKLAIIIEKHSLSSFSNEIHFLSENFSNYLLKSITTYNSIIQTGNSEQNETSKNICLGHIKLLQDQLDLIIDNVSSLLQDEALNELNIRTKFLESKFDSKLSNEEFSNIVKIK